MVAVTPPPVLRRFPPAPGSPPRRTRAGWWPGLAREVDQLRRAVEPLLGLPGPGRRPHPAGDRPDQRGRRAHCPSAAQRRARRGCCCPPTRTSPPRCSMSSPAGCQVVYLRYPDGADHLPECWAWHPDVVEELLWLMHAWAAAYQGPQAWVALVGDWHDRQRPGVVRRIKTTAGIVLDREPPDPHRLDPPSVRRPHSSRRRQRRADRGLVGCPPRRARTRARGPARPGWPRCGSTGASMTPTRTGPHGRRPAGPRRTAAGRCGRRSGSPGSPLPSVRPWPPRTACSRSPSPPGSRPGSPGSTR